MHKIMEKRKFVQVKNGDVYFTLVVCVYFLVSVVYNLSLQLQRLGPFVVVL